MKCLRPLLRELEKDIREWIRRDKPISADTKRPVEFDEKSYAYSEYFKQKKIDPKLDLRYSKYYRNERHTIAGSYVWADSSLSEFADELEKPVHDSKLCWIDVLINCQFGINNSGEVVGLTGEIYDHCEVLILLTKAIFKRAWCLLEAANYTRNCCKICVVGQCSFLQGEDYFAAMQAGSPSDVALIKEEIAHMFGVDHRAKFNRAIDDAVVQVYGEFLLDNGRFQEAVPVFEKELEVKKRRDDDESSVAETYRQLGRASEALGKYADSLRYYDEALQRYIRCYVRCFDTWHGFDVRVADTYNNIGIVFKELGDYEKALFHYQKALDIQIKSFGGAHLSVAQTYNNMGAVYQTQGDYEKALFHYQNALDIKIKSLGGAHVSVADTKNNIAMVLEKQGKFDEALKLYQEALETTIQAVGPSHVSVADTYVNMGVGFRKQGDYEKALFHYQNALEIYKKSLGDCHVSVASTYNNMAIVEEKLGNLQNALDLYQKALDIKIKSLGEAHVAVAYTKNNMAIVYGNLGNQTKRLQLNREAHAIYIQALGPDHPKTKGITLLCHCELNLLGLPCGTVGLDG